MTQIKNAGSIDHLRSYETTKYTHSLADDTGFMGMIIVVRIRVRNLSFAKCLKMRPRKNS